MSSDNIVELEAKRICADCIGEDFLRNRVEQENDEDQCSYCENAGLVISIDDMADIIEVVFEAHYSITASEPDAYEYALLKDKEIAYEWDREGEPTVYAIMNAADVSEEAANDIQKVLSDRHYFFDKSTIGEEWPFSWETHYEEIMPDDEEWQESWNLFERTIKTEARFFSRIAAKQLSELFDALDEMRTRQGQPLIIEAGPEADLNHLYRARVFQSDGNLEQAMMRPDKELGAPPSQFANAGRMNARGISVFYGASTVETAIAEVRPPVGSQVAVVRFEIIRPIKLLDLTALGRVHEYGSIFDPTYANRLGRMMFLRKLSNRIARPVMPDDQESEYLPTQAIADFLATEGKVPLDGILFPSVQVDGSGLNAVLFHKAAKCREIVLPDGADLRARTYMHAEDGPEPDYHVIEEVPPEKDESEEEDEFGFFNFAALHEQDMSEYDVRDETLSVDLESMRVHRVNAVQFDTAEFEVRRHRWTKTNPDF